MNTEQIEQLCRSDQVLSPKFGGVFSRDNLPDLAEDAKFYVCNTDPSSEPGDHWVVLHAAAEGGEYFDSLGGAINHDEFAQFLGGEYRYVSVQTQELFSSVCSQYCIFYMCLRARGHSMDDIVHVLDIQGEGSDRFVTCFVKLFYGVEY